jgi:RNA ligase
MFTLQETHQAIQGRNEFVIHEKEGLISFDYYAILEDTFHTDPRTAFIRGQLRGVTFDSNGDILSLPFHKFYNVNEREETSFELLKDLDATIYEKLDGTMIHFFIHKGELKASSRTSSFTYHAQLALKFVDRNPDLKNNIIKTVQSGYTPMFEYCSPGNQILVHYPKARLVYLTSRNRTTGDYIHEDCYEDVPLKYNFKFSEILNHTHYQDFEGYVCYLGNKIVKVKNNWYFENKFKEENLFRIYNKSVFNLFKIVIQDNSFDDLIAKSPKEYKQILRMLKEEYSNDFLVESTRIKNLYQKVKRKFDRQNKETRYDMVKLIKETCPEDFSLIIQCHNQPEEKAIKEMIDKKLLYCKYKNRSEKITSYLLGYE